jgi:integrase/recombinase XerC/integrase/recombinase XerD
MADPEMKFVELRQEDIAFHVEQFILGLKDKQPETRGTYQRALWEFVRWHAMDGRFRFQVADVARYKRHLSESKRLSEVSVSTYLTAVRQFCEYLRARGILDVNPARFVDGNKRPAVHSREVLTDQDIERLLALIDRSSLRGRRDYAIVRLMLDAALSEIEIIRANVGDIQVRGDFTVIRVQGKGRESKDEVVELSAITRRALDEYFALRNAASDDEPLALSAGNRTRGERMTTRGIRNRVNYYLEMAGVKQGRLRRVTPFSLRHTAAVRLAEAGASADEIKRRMRLGSIATAMLYVNHKNRRPLLSGSQS